MAIWLNGNLEVRKLKMKLKNCNLIGFVMATTHKGIQSMTIAIVLKSYHVQILITRLVPISLWEMLDSTAQLRTNPVRLS